MVSSAKTLADNRVGGDDMRKIAGALLGLSLLAGAAASAMAADCKVTGWIDSGQGGRPIFTCPQPTN
jgi:hypothetical protein